MTLVFIKGNRIRHQGFWARDFHQYGHGLAREFFFRGPAKLAGLPLGPLTPAPKMRHGHMWLGF